ncbi:MAG: bifunctional diaminohydroxyphosphoribosylaminopyrimidine deaminase/5-amino-6-(5-phosphoribosylamino)uracil reductase RibD [Alphaproteobacteria bacterium]|nr:bifunctional diaminohydroxyphosphoribosylaminopyrimidine deaminase/5-amino-6-(5-phosphoribosylamino)uracil reductase RibD [Alphaproteobacteria bacterium]
MGCALTCDRRPRQSADLALAAPKRRRDGGFFMAANGPHQMGFMQEAIALARRGRQTAAPNPMVGCVLVRDGRIVGRGWHRSPGCAHAEVAAIADAGAAARGATAYVTLEPCNHTGRTRPCVDAIIAAGIGEVVYALPDPNPVAAGGADRLRAAGVETTSGLCKDEARELVRGWLHALQRKRPLVIAKAAMSLDGRIAAPSGESKWLTGPAARRIGHELRADCDAILVGVGTLTADDPSLTARLDDATLAPLRVVLDTNGASPIGAKAFERSGRGALILTTEQCSQSQARMFRDCGVDVAICGRSANGRVDLDDALAALADRGVLSVMVEGGGKALGAFLDEDLIDEIHLFYAPMLLGGGRAAFDGRGVARIADAGGFDFDAPRAVGPDFVVRGRRRRAR